jgi:hypothetical protein
MVKLAICYWGMTRSTKLVYKSHEKYLFTILQGNNIEYTVFMHTWKTDCNKHRIRQSYSNADIDYEEYKLLHPDFYKIDNQEYFLNTINLADFMNDNLYGDEKNSELRSYSIRNHLCALESQKRVYKMVTNTMQPYDYILYIRPDAMIYQPFDVNCINDNFDFITLNQDHFERICDRFALIPFDKSYYYSTRINEIADFRKKYGRIVSEKYANYIVKKYYTNVKCIDFHMKIIRPDEIS